MARQVGEQPKFDAEQMRYLEERRKVVGEARIKEVEAEWSRLMAEVRRRMETGTPASDPRILDLARRWQKALCRICWLTHVALQISIRIFAVVWWA